MEKEREREIRSPLLQGTVRQTSVKLDLRGLLGLTTMLYILSHTYTHKHSQTHGTWMNSNPFSLSLYF